jgi:hypothetical protein
MATSKSSSGSNGSDSTSTETQQTLAEPPTDAGSTNGTAGAAKAASEPSGGQDEATTPEESTADTSEGPQVVDDENGQRVLMPDGSTVVTRQHAFPMTNAEQAVYEETHTGDQPRYSLTPGDAGYSPFSDPAVPNSHLAQSIEREIASFADRIKNDASAVVSPIWQGLKGIYQEQLDHAIETGEESGKVRL